MCSQGVYKDDTQAHIDIMWSWACLASLFRDALIPRRAWLVWPDFTRTIIVLALTCAAHSINFDPKPWPTALIYVPVCAKAERMVAHPQGQL